MMITAIGTGAFVNNSTHQLVCERLKFKDLIDIKEIGVFR